MKQKKKIGFIGGDKRITCLHDMIKNEGYDTKTYLTDCNDNSDQLPKCFEEEIIIGPVPLVKPFPYLNAKNGVRENIFEIIERMKPGGIFAAGVIPDQLIRAASEREIAIFDYAESEEFQILNARLTAEGAVKIALDNGKRSLCDSHVLIIGYGRIGKALCNTLSGFHCKLTITARKTSDLSYITINGLDGLHTDDIHKVVGLFDIIINTVPAPVITKEVLDRVKSDVLIIDLASLPGGTDFDYAKSKGIKYDHALSIPGKFFFYSASSVIYKILHNILEIGV